MDRYAAVSWVEEQASFSAIKIKQVRVNEPEGWTCSMIVGRQYDAETKPGEFHECEIIATGTRKKMEKVVLDKAAEAAESSFMEKDEDFFKNQKQTRKERAKRPSELVPGVNGSDCTKRKRLAEKDDNRRRSSEDVVMQMMIPGSPQVFSLQEAEQAGASENDNIENFDPAVMGELNETTEEGNDASTDEVQSLKRRLRKALRQNKILEQKVRTLENPTFAAEPQQVVIGDGITANKSVVDDIIMDFSRNPSKFLRQLMVRTKKFTLEEMAKSSVKGFRSRDGQRPALDVHKFSAVKRFTIQTCGIRENTVEMMNFEKSMVSLCSDARKMLKTKSIS